MHACHAGGGEMCVCVWWRNVCVCVFGVGVGWGQFDAAASANGAHGATERWATSTALNMDFGRCQWDRFQPVELKLVGRASSNKIASADRLHFFFSFRDYRDGGNAVLHIKQLDHMLFSGVRVLLGYLISNGRSTCLGGASPGTSCVRGGLVKQSKTASVKQTP
jgi:hypothetical protein